MRPPRRADEPPPGGTEAFDCEMSDVDVCAACGKERADKKCAACRMVSYCSKECQRSHWRAEHKKVCKRGCVVEYKGTIEDGVSRERVEFRYTKTLPSRTVRDKLLSGNEADGLAVVEGIIEEFHDPKFRLRDEWTCRCGATATQIVSHPACNPFLSAVGDPPVSISMLEYRAMPSCARHVARCKSQLLQIGDMMHRSMQDGSLGDPNIIVNGQVPRGGRPLPADFRPRP